MNFYDEAVVSLRLKGHCRFFFSYLVLVITIFYFAQGNKQLTKDYFILLISFKTASLYLFKFPFWVLYLDLMDEYLNFNCTIALIAWLVIFLSMCELIKGELWFSCKHGASDIDKWGNGMWKGNSALSLHWEVTKLIDLKLTSLKLAL